MSDRSFLHKEVKQNLTVTITIYKFGSCKINMQNLTYSDLHFMFITLLYKNLIS